MAGFSVNIGADTAQLATGLSRAQADILQFANAVVINSGNAVNALGQIPAALKPINPAQMQALRDAVQKLKQDVQTAPAAINATAAALNNLNKGASAANGAVLDFSRIVQDLPFGMVGIINNVQQIPGSLQRLSAASKETGKSVGSLLLSSITGVGGLGLAVAAVTSGMLIYQNGIVGFTQKTKQAKDEAEKLRDLLKSVKSAAETTFEGIGSSQGQVIQVRALAAAVSDETKSQVERGRALEKLKSINKEYFGDLKLQEDSLRTLTPLVNEYTNAIIQQAIISELSSEIGKIGATFVKQARAVSDAKDALNRYKESLNIPAADKAGNRVFVLDKNIDALNLNLKKAQDTLAPTAAKFQDLSQALNDATTASLKYKLTQTGPDKKEEDALKKRLEALEKIKALTKNATTLVGLQEAIFELQVKIAIRDQGKNRLSKQEIDQQIQGYKNELQKAFDQQAIELEAIPKVRFSPTIRAEIPTGEIQSIVAKATGLDKKIPIPTEFEIDAKLLGNEQAFKNQINKDLSKFINTAIKTMKVDLAVAIGEGIGEGLAMGDFGKGLIKAAQNILSVVGGVLQQIGRQVIAAAIAIKTLKESLEKWAIANPALAVIAGIGVVALGTALKNIKFDGPKFAHGGIVTGPIIGQIGEQHRPEVIMPLDRLPQMLRSIGGGDNNLQFVPIINNEGLYLAVQRGARRAGRKF